jgi:L-ascorbate metabolism protein UlaG (beta-lactamase superfamily)
MRVWPYISCTRRIAQALLEYARFQPNGALTQETMDIIWHGHSCFTLKSKDAVVVTDPFEMGAKLPKLKADIVSLSGEGETIELEGDPKILDWPGEFEASNTPVESLAVDGNSSVFIFMLDGVKVCHLGTLSNEPSDELLERIGDVDILLVPVGGGVVLDGKTAQKVVEAIEPRIVIPMLYSATESKLQLGGAEEFLKAVGKSELAPREKYSVSGRSALPEGVMEFVVLEPKL